MSDHSLEAVTPAFSIQLWNFAPRDPGPGGWRHLIDLARAADAAGVDRLVLSDHVILGERLEEYARPEIGGQKGGKQPTGPEGQWLEPHTLFSLLAGVTRRTRFLHGILIAALRRPVVLAKSLATLDVLSEGRVDFGVGVGWQREEYEAAGLPFEGRGRQLEQTLEICQTLWTQESASYKGPGYDFSGIHCNPKPLQPGGIPIWVSGTLNRSVLARIARFGRGWIPWGDDALDPLAGLARVREALAAAGRDSAGFQCTTHVRNAMRGEQVDLEATMAALPRLAEGGITDFRMQLPVPADPSAATDYLAKAVAAFRRAVGRPAA